MSAWLAPVLAVCAGWSVDRMTSPRSLPSVRVSSIVLWGVVIMGSWMAVLDAAGLRWTPLLLSVPALAGLGTVLLSGRAPSGTPGGPASARRAGTWELAALAAVGLRAFAVASVPVFGWDFRYIWGLKARVFAAGGGIDLAWLAWRPFELARLDYPPLWSMLIAAGRIFGAPAAGVAAAWGALIAVGLGVVCWRIARPSGRAAAALAAAAGAWTPVLLAPEIGTSGSAEPLAAFLLAVAVAGLLAGRDRPGTFPWLAAAALAALGVTKDEGTVLAVVLAGFAAAGLPRRQRAPLLGLALLPAAAWQITVSVAGIPRLPEILVPARILHRAVGLPGAVVAAATPALILELAVLSLVLLCPAPHDSRFFRRALGAWFAVAVAAYLTSAFGLRWQVATSLERVLAIPLPASLALLLRWSFELSPPEAVHKVEVISAQGEELR